MSECWEEGGLRAYYDRELPQEEMARAAAHLGACADCHARYNELAGRAARVASMMDALFVTDARALPAQTKLTVMPRRRGWAFPAAAGLLTLAAAAALVFALTPKRVETPARVVTPSVPHVNRPMQATAPVETQPETHRAAPVRMAHSAAPRHTQAKPQTEYFLAFDDQPIDAGVVMRVALDGDSALQADVVFDREGRARAIRPVKDAK
jgi:hypothetical protein